MDRLTDSLAKRAAGAHSTAVLWMFVQSMEKREPGLVELIKSFMPRAYDHDASYATESTKTMFVLSAGVRLASSGAAHEAVPILRAALPEVRRRLGSRHPHVREAAVALASASKSCEDARLDANEAKPTTLLRDGRDHGPGWRADVPPVVGVDRETHASDLRKYVPKHILDFMDSD